MIPFFPTNPLIMDHLSWSTAFISWSTAFISWSTAFMEHRVDLGSTTLILIIVARIIGNDHPQCSSAGRQRPRRSWGRGKARKVGYPYLNPCTCICSPITGRLRLIFNYI